MKVTTRQIQPGDYQAVADLLNSAYAETGTALGETSEDVERRSAGAVVVVTEVTGTIAGTMTLGAAGTPYGTLARPGEMEASRLAVNPRFQGLGIGKEMLAGVAQIARAQGIGSLVGISLDAMSAAHRLYESLGAVPVDIPGAKAIGYTLDLTTENT